MQQRTLFRLGGGKVGALPGVPFALRILLVVLCLGGLLRTPLALVKGEEPTIAQRSAMLPSSLHRQLDVAPSWPAAVNNDAEIVYLDAQGYIHTLDPLAPTSGATVQWVSPTGGWRDVALGDFNNDGDLEIVAVGGEANSGRLAIYDPVSTAAPFDAERIINEVPWAVLYEAPLLGRPLQVATGDLNPAIPGVEIAFVFSLNPEDKVDQDDKTRLSIWQADLSNGSVTPDGSHWESAATDVDFGNTWEHLALGELDNVDGEEVVLVDDGIGLVRVYRLEEVTNGEDENAPTEILPKKIYENESGARPWLDGIVARFAPSDLPQLAMTRSSNPGGNTFWVLYYDPSADSSFSDAYAEFLLPAPQVIFAGDIDNNGDDEIFLLRNVPVNDNRVRLIMRNYDNVNHPLPTFELPLDTDNGYQAGTAGDTDGDGRAEVIIMRNDRIRVYNAPESNSADLADNTPTVTTDQRTIVAGNLDRNGIPLLPKLSVTTALITQVSLYAGQQRTESLRIETLASGAPGAIPFTITVADQPDWLTIAAQNGTTNTTIDVLLDATKLRGGLYQTTITLTSSDKTVANSPLTIPVSLNVLPGLVPATSSLLVPYDCSQPTTPIERTLLLNGPDNLIFSAAVNNASVTSEIANLNQTSSAMPLVAATTNLPTTPAVLWPSDKAWLSASSPNVLPTTMQLTFDPAGLAAGVESDTATLALFFYDAQGRQERTVALTLFCAPTQLYLPLIRR